MEHPRDAASEYGSDADLTEPAASGEREKVLEREREARRQAVATGLAIARLQTLSIELADATTPTEAAGLIVGALGDYFDHVSLVLSRDDGELETLAMRCGDELAERVLSQLASEFAAPGEDIVSSKMPTWVGPADGNAGDSTELEALVGRLDGRAAVLPLKLPDAAGAIVGVGTTTEPSSLDEQTSLLALAGVGSTGLAAALARDSMRQSIATLQRGLLPDGLPSISRIDAAAIYEPAGEATLVGGDWYGLVAAREGQILAAIGDVSGHGLDAVGAMGEARALFHAYAYEGFSPGQLLSRLNAVFSLSSRRGRMMTAACVSLDVERGTLRYALAGHPAPTLVLPDGAVCRLEAARGLPVGVEDDIDYPEATRDIPAHALLFLYTDGLLERRDRATTRRLALLESTIADMRERSADELTRVVTARLGLSTHDDTALLAIKVTADTASVR